MVRRRVGTISRRGSSGRCMMRRRARPRAAPASGEQRKIIAQGWDEGPCIRSCLNGSISEVASPTASSSTWSASPRNARLGGMRRGPHATLEHHLVQQVTFERSTRCAAGRAIGLQAVEPFWCRGREKRRKRLGGMLVHLPAPTLMSADRRAREQVRRAGRGSRRRSCRAHRLQVADVSRRSPLVTLDCATARSNVSRQALSATSNGVRRAGARLEEQVHERRRAAPEPF